MGLKSPAAPPPETIAALRLVLVELQVIHAEGLRLKAMNSQLGLRIKTLTTAEEAVEVKTAIEFVAKRLRDLSRRQTLLEFEVKGYNAAEKHLRDVGLKECGFV